MVLLGVNCGFSGIDCSEIPLDAIDLDNACHDFRRPKTLEPRRGILWPETVSVVRDYLSDRPKPQRGHEWRLFVNSQGSPWITASTPTKGRIDKITQLFGLYVRQLGFHQHGVNFGSLRHTFATIGAEAGERHTLERILGHAPSSVTEEFYIEFLSDQRLRKVTNHIRRWPLRTRCDRCGRGHHAWKPCRYATADILHQYLFEGKIG